ncbi:helix-turn-helix domain-containing protein [Nonomuraea harbinensis]|uniref:Helix-turn-helix domain-containing protein n=1 Tax=Nonomuraea harbinensis TaxID=1286938 RepID=A0ABW1C7D0_9ACTN|nr:helix-turn-helix transcriptional regulator [Nonomuraea harbinensis]
MAREPKQGARAERETLRAEMAEAGCSTVQIVAEMRARWRIRPREAWRHAHGWSLQQAATKLNVAAAQGRGKAVAADASLVGKWEKWPGPSSRRPTLHVLTLLAQVYGCTIVDLLDLNDRRAMPDEELQLINQPPTDPDPAPEPPQAAGLDPADPQPLNGAELLNTAAAESATWAQWAEATNIGDIALEQLQADTRALARSYLTGDPLEVFRSARHLRDQVFALLEGRQYPRQSAELYATAGYLCALLAWISSDLGQLSAADTHGRTAWLCAELTGHDDLRAWVLSTRSKIAFWDGRYRDAINLARRGASYRPHGTAGILLACQEADAWAALGGDDDARAALARADAARDHMDGVDEVAGLFTCSPFRHANYGSSVLLRIGRPDDALCEADRALADTRHQPQAYGTVAQVRIVQATAHLALGQPDGARAPVRAILAIPPHQRLDPVTRRVRELAAALARSPMGGSTPGVVLRQEIEEWERATVSRMIALDRGDSR